MSGKAGKERATRAKRERSCRDNSKYGTYSESESEPSITDSGLASTLGEESCLLELREDLPERAGDAVESVNGVSCLTYLLIQRVR